tara:strand:- start:3735 stop:5462 length:1728 start_codon:yes stop_codon:yes gene_type:complete
MKKKNFPMENFNSRLFLRVFTFLIIFSNPALSETIYFNETGGIANRMTIANIENRGLKGKRVRFSLKSANLMDSKSNKFLGDGKFTDLVFPRLKNTDEINKPRLPYLALFMEGRPSDFIVDVREGPVKKVSNILPRPNLKLPCRCLKEGDEIEPLDRETYEDEFNELYEIDYLGDFRGIEISRIKLYPSRYDGMDRELFVYPKIEFSIFDKSKNIVASHEVKDLLEVDSVTNKKFVVVGPERFFEALEPWKKWKEEQGFKVKLISLEGLGQSAKDVKSFFRSEYKRDAFSWALLLGHEEIMPTNYVKTDSHDKTPSDLDYFTMGGLRDNIPDVFYGRFVVDSLQDLEVQVLKTIQFEKGAYANKSGYKRQIGIASDEGYDPTDVEYLKNMQNPLEKAFGLRPYKFLQEKINSTPENINKVLNKGAIWLNYIGHGEGSTWPSLHSRSYHSNDVKNIDGKGKVKPVIIDVACQNGRFSFDNRLGERFLNETKGNDSLIGAVAYYGGSVDISWHPPAKMAVIINQILAKGKSTHLGKLLFNGQMELFKKHSTKKEVIDNLKWYHLLGDPSLRIDSIKN